MSFPEAPGRKPKLAAGLWVVGTPIGNLEDVSARALETLRRADVVACEDTRTTARLLDRYGIQARTVSYFEHSPEGRTREILSLIRGGAGVALVSEAGTPAVSDPGARLVAAAHREGLAVFAVPGPSAVTAALSVAGFSADRFVFEGFLPKRAGKRRRLLRELAEQDRTVVFFESPHRIEAALDDCVDAFGAGREGAIVREITKAHEEVRRGTLEELREAARANPRGEFTVVIAGSRARE